MKKALFVAGIIGTSLFGSVSFAGDNHIKVFGSVGEWQNEIDTSQYAVEARQHVTDNLYFIGRHEQNEHDFEGLDGGISFLGGGIHLDNGLGIQYMRSFDDSFWISPYYAATHGKLDVKGELIYRDKTSENESITGLKSSLGYRALESLSVGVFYEVRNVSKRMTDDLYGAYLGYHW